MFNGHASASAMFEHELNEYKSVAVSRVIHDFYDSDAKRGFYGGGGMDMRFVQYPVGFGLRGLPQDAPKWGHDYKAMLRERFTHSVNASGHTTSLPVESNTHLA